MNQQAIDRVKERLSKYLKRTDDSDKSYDNGYCKALEHTLEDLQALGDGWIPVTKKLPTYQGFYLVKIKGRGVEVRYAMVYFKECGIEFQNEDVTHWQPLPNPPTK